MVFNIVDEKMKEVVLMSIVELAREKGGEHKMVSAIDIVTDLRNKGIVGIGLQVANIIIDVLIEERLIRYYKNERGYRYYGIPKNEWQKYA